MRFIHTPAMRAIGFACVLAQPQIADMAPRQLTLTPFALQDCRCRGHNEEEREERQRVADVMKALGVQPGAVVGDIGAGGGFYTVRLARAVGESGRVYAVDTSSSVLQDLRARILREGLANVEVIEGAAADPRLPEGTLDAALIVNAYHEMSEHQAMLTHIRRALKPSGRLVILEPISPSRRTAPRDEQTRRHEIAPEIVQEDARAAGFRMVRIEDPFSTHADHGTEWLMVLVPAGGPPDDGGKR